ncbi:ABC transporter substrate-binding protein [Candidatus Poriferisodalis sp.]|uniref:ABC transporter substrate-binding protein n=1 Tax=Candidatus Poriferisodalis sp. TaxID=3101277 RepID=UPI003B0172FA
MLFATALIAAACGSDDDADGDAAAPTTEATAASDEMSDDMSDDDMDEHMDDDMSDDDMDEHMDDDMSDDDMDEHMDDDDMMDLAGTKVSVFGPESSDEEAGALRDALDHFADRTGIEISYTGARDAADQINAQAAGGNPPDIFIFPQPGKLADFARNGHLIALPDDVVAAMNEHWTPAWTSFGDVDGTQYGIPNKSDLKSLVWYKPALFESKGYEVPGTWDELKALSAEMIANGDTPFCIGIESGPATGWTFTDWVEDLMLRFHTPADYDAWVAGDLAFSSDEVSGVFNEVLDLWNTPGMVFAAGGSIAATPFGDNGQPLVDNDCMMHRQASFYAAFIPEGTVFADGSADAVDTFYFPSVKGDQPVLGAGTLVGAFRDAPEVWEVMKYFGSSEYAELRQRAQTERKGGGLSGFLSAATNQDPNVYQPLEQSFLDILQNADVVRFDGSDLMPAEVGAGTFWTEGTAVVNGDKSVAEATQAIDDSWPR